MKNPKHREFGYKDGDKNLMHFQSLSSYHEAKIAKQAGISLCSTLYNWLTFCLKRSLFFYKQEQMLLEPFKG